MKLRENVPISTLTTMRLGGSARYVAEVHNLAEVKEAYDFARENSLPVYPLGSGSNTIGRDEGFPGLIILNRLKGMEVIEETSDDVLVRSAGGEIWDDFVKFCTDRGYSGIEAMSGIPGTVGAAPVQNIGAYGQSLSNTLDHIEVYDTKEREMIILGHDELKMRYRKTILNTEEAGRYFVTAITLRLENFEHLEPPFYNSLQKYLDEHKITEYSPTNIRNAVLAIRGDKLPDPAVQPSAGSFFKNVQLSPDEAEVARTNGYKVYKKSDGSFTLNSGWLIEEAGLKGKQFHNFQVSDKASLILINVNAKSYHELDQVRSEIIKTVFEKSGYKLEQEPVEIPSTGFSERDTRPASQNSQPRGKSANEQELV